VCKNPILDQSRSTEAELTHIPWIRIATRDISGPIPLVDSQKSNKFPLNWSKESISYGSSLRLYLTNSDKIERERNPNQAL